MSIGRPKRLYDAINRIVAPTRPSLRGPSKLNSSELTLYRSKEWIPRINNPGTKGLITFPMELVYGLNEELLMKVFHQVQNDEDPLSWRVRGIPDYGFYQDLHYFLKASLLNSQSSSKVSIGKFYIAVDDNLKDRGFRPINAYRFIERIVSQNNTRTSIVSYSLMEDLEANILKRQVRECTDLAQKLMLEIDALKKERDASKKEFDQTRTVFRDAVREMHEMIKEFVIDLKQTSSVLKLHVQDDIHIDNSDSLFSLPSLNC